MLNIIRPLNYILPIAIIIAVGLISCEVPQSIIYRIDAPEMKMYDNNYFVHESDRLTLHYDFWSEGGVPLIDFINISPDTLLIDFTKSYFTIDKNSFYFAGDKWAESVEKMSDKELYSTMFATLPKKHFLYPDSTFSFQGVPFGFQHLDELDASETQTYLYTNTPYKANHLFHYQIGQDSIGVDSVKLQFYLAEATSIPSSDFKDFQSGEPLVANRFYLHQYPPFSFDDRHVIGEVLNLLFRR